MAARPNALRTLEYGKRLVENQLKRLDEMIYMADKVLQESKTLTAEDVSGYKACIATGKKQVTLFNKLAEIPLPDITEAPSRKRGRPSKAELEQLAVNRGEKPAKAPKALAKAEPVVSTPVTASAINAPKKRGRKSKATIEAETAAAAALVAAPVATPKKRGRPPKAKTETTPEPVQTAQVSRVNQDLPVKRRGRPPKVKSDEVVEVVQTAPDAPKRPGRKPKSTTPAINVAPIAEGEPVKRGPGRPKGSKNAPKLMNGQHTEIINVN